MFVVCCLLLRVCCCSLVVVCRGLWLSFVGLLSCLMIDLCRFVCVLFDVLCSLVGLSELYVLFFAIGCMLFLVDFVCCAFCHCCEMIVVVVYCSLLVVVG